MKQQRKLIILSICIITMFITTHLTPSLAIRTHLVVTAYPNYAISSGIVFDEFLYKLNKDYFDKRNSKCYGITGVPIIKSNGIYTKPNNYERFSYIFAFEVRKIGFLYFAFRFGEA